MWFTYHKPHPFKVYGSVVLSIFTKLYNHHHHLIPESLCSPLASPAPTPSHICPVQMHLACSCLGVFSLVLSGTLYPPGPIWLTLSGLCSNGMFSTGLLLLTLHPTFKTVLHPHLTTYLLSLSCVIFFCSLTLDIYLLFIVCLPHLNVSSMLMGHSLCLFGTKAMLGT